MKRRKWIRSISPHEKKNAFKIFIFFLVLTGWGYQPVFSRESENKNESITELDKITVSASQEHSSFSGIISEETFDVPSTSGSILDALENQAGIQFRRNSLSGADGSKLRLRGFEETRLNIMKDGITLNRDGSYGNGAVDWSSISPENVDHIKIYPGACPAKFGNTLGGVVDIVTKKPTEVPSVLFKGTFGAMDTWNTSIDHSWKVNGIGWALSAGHFETDGYLRNNYLDRDNFSALFTFELPGKMEIGAGMDYSWKENGNPVYNRPDSPYYDGSKPDADDKEIGGPGIGGRLLDGNDAWGDGSFTEDENTAFTAFVSKKMDKGSCRLDFRLWNQERSETFYDAGEPGKKIYERETDAEDNNWSLNGEADYEIAGHTLAMGGETRSHGWGEQRVKFIDDSYFNGSINFMKFIRDGFKGQPDILRYHALYVQDNWRIHPGFSMEMGLRQEWFSADKIDPDAFGYEWPAGEADISENHLDPRLALLYRPWEGGLVTTRFGLAHRYPTSPEYFWWYLNNSTDYFNTDFSSEKSTQYELSFEQSLQDRLNLFVRGYYYDIDDYISSTTIPGIGSVFFNIGQVKIKGVEVGFSAALPFNLRAWGNVTWQDGDKADDPWDSGNALSSTVPDFPDKMFNAGVEYADAEKIKAGLWVNYVGEREHFTSNTLVKMDSYTLLNFSLSLRILEIQGTKVDFQLSADNILDEEYEEESGYPMPGSVVMAGIRLKF